MPHGYTPPVAPSLKPYHLSPDFSEGLLCFGPNVNVALINPPPPKLVLVPGVWRGRKKRVGANNADSGGLGGG